MRRRRFWYHYNKPASKEAGKTVLTVHYDGACMAVDKISCKVPTETHARQRQPYCVVRGWCEGCIFIRRLGKVRTELVATIY